MVENTGIRATPEYANESTLGNYTWEQMQEHAGENMRRGYEPYETYPAKWHNSVLHQLTATLEEIKVYCDGIQAELKNILVAAGVTPDPQVHNQLAVAIARISNLPIATASVLGGVKSSADDWNVAVNGTTGVMSVNKVDASTAKKGIVQLIDNLTTEDATKALTAKQGKALKDTIDGLDADDPVASGTTASFIASISQTDGKITAAKKTVQSASTSQKGIVQLIDNLTTDDATKALTAKQGKALKDAITGLDAAIAGKQPAGSYKTIQDAVADPPTPGTTEADFTLDFISNISQDTNGVITPTKKHIMPASTASMGIVKLNNTLTSTSAAQALTAAQGKALQDRINGLNVDDPTATGTGTSTTFIASISQTQGAIYPIKRTLPSASTTQQGIVKLNNTLTSDSVSQALTAFQGYVLKNAIDSLNSKYSAIYSAWLKTRRVTRQFADYIKICNQMDKFGNDCWAIEDIYYNPLLRQLTLNIDSTTEIDASTAEGHMNIWLSHLPKIDDTGAAPWPLQWATSGTQVSNVLVSAHSSNLDTLGAGSLASQDADIYYIWDTYNSSNWMNSMIPTGFAPIVLLRITIGENLNIHLADSLKITLFLSNNPGSEIMPE